MNLSISDYANKLANAIAHGLDQIAHDFKCFKCRNERRKIEALVKYAQSFGMSLKVDWDFLDKNPDVRSHIIEYNRLADEMAERLSQWASLL